MPSLLAAGCTFLWRLLALFHLTWTCLRHVLGQDKWQKSLWTCQFVLTCCKVQICPQMSTNTPNVHGMSFREGLEDRIWGRGQSLLMGAWRSGTTTVSGCSL
jgi:hypothetical protein